MLYYRLLYPEDYRLSLLGRVGYTYHKAVKVLIAYHWEPNKHPTLGLVVPGDNRRVTYRKL